MVALKDAAGTFYNKQNIDYEYLLNPSHIDGLGDLTMSVIQKYLDNTAVKDYDLIEMIKSASEKIMTQKLLLVPHSQGNFYANSFYDVVAGQPGGIPKESLGIYAVATPSARVAGGGKWITSDTDKVIADIVPDAPFTSTLKPNVHIDLHEGDDFWGHDFAGVYLKYEGSRMVSDIKASLSYLKSNTDQDSQKPCIDAPSFSTIHVAEGAALGAADFVAGVSGTAISGAAAGVYAVGDTVSSVTSGTLAMAVGATQFAVATTAHAAAAVYHVGASVVHAAITSIQSTQPDPELAQVIDAVEDVPEKTTSVAEAAQDVAIPPVSEMVSSVASTTLTISDLVNEQNFASDTQDEDIATTSGILAVATTSDAQLAEPTPVPPPPVPQCSFATSASSTHQGLIINEVAWMGSVTSANDEWIELHNISGAPLNISGWQVLDKDEQIRIMFGNDHVIENGGYLLLERTDDASVPGVTADAIYAGALSNTDEGLRLFDNHCDLIDEVLAQPNWPAGDGSMRRTMERSPDLSWHTYVGGGMNREGVTIYGTPRAANSEPGVATTGSVPAQQVSDPVPDAQAADSQPAKLLISEVQTTGGSGKTHDDFIELYNPNATPVNLNGYRLVKRTKTGTSDSSIKSWAEDAFIPAQGYYLWANSEYADIGAAPDATTTATLADDNGIALRYGPEDTGTIIDSVGWGAAENSFIEGSVFSENPAAGESVARSSATDTDVNADDFILAIPSPKNSVVSGGFISPDPVLAVTSSPAADHAVISEVYPDQTGANDDFIELYNPTANSIDVSGWSVQMLSGNATTTDKIEKKDFVSGNMIPSSGFFLVGVDRYAGGDMTWASGSLN
ncbi:MAG: lamin tail domain-containing protein, partial [Patescibacteria group bacterium]|nr:lamin tail domain-containing protein [Patescibacteria group bacterium]